MLPALDFVVATLQRLWPEFSADDVTVFRHKTKSGVAEQPWGLEGGSQGAVGRTQDAGLRAQVNAQAQAGNNVVIVSLENTVAPVPLSTASMPAAWQAEHGDAYVDAAGLVAVDVAALHVELFAGGARQVVQGLSPGVIVPRALVDEVRHSGAPAERAGFDVTVGQVIASAHGLRNDDWHAAFVGQSRSQLLSQGLLALPVTTTA